MGCDIHGVLQGRIEGGTWRSILEIEDTRNYAVFSALAGVRNYENIEPIAEPRGLPEDFDMKEAMLVMRYGDDPYVGDHSFSWLSLDELETWPRWIEEPRYEMFLAWLGYARQKVDSQYWTEARVVFGFDS